LKKQKGTGGARAGSIKSPTIRGGATVFGPHPRDYSFKLNKKIKRLARFSALTYKAKEDINTAVIGIGYKDGFFTTKQNDAYRFIDVLRYMYTDFRSIGKKQYLYQGKYEILGRVGMYCAIVKNDGSLRTGDIVKADCNPLFIDSAIEREYR
jgi:ribosomal protein L4